MPNTIAIGVAYSDQAISAGSLDSSPVGATTASTGAFTTLNSSTTSVIGATAGVSTGFHGTAAVQVSFVAQLTAPTTAGFASTAQAALAITAINALLTAGISKGIMAAS